VARQRGLRDLAFGPHLRRRSARVRLTAVYCGVFLPTGLAIAVITYVMIILVQLPTTIGHVVAEYGHGASAKALNQATAGHNLDGTTVTLPGHLVLDSREFLVGSCIVLVTMIGVSVLLGWFVAGRVLRPLQAMTITTRQISERNLHERLALTGPDDELKDLGDTIDGLLARLEAAFDSQRRFVANASHELRTPLMLGQTILQVALSNPDITLDTLRAACQEAVDAGRDEGQLIDALLTLARSQRGLDHREPVDLTAVVYDALDAHRRSAVARGIYIDVTIDDVTVSGDARLIYRLTSNLVDNAIRYNFTGGLLEVTLIAGTTAAVLTLSNTGPSVLSGHVSRLLEPFQRAATDRTVSPSGLGLGLSIVADIAQAHGASLDVLPRPGGGLTVAVSFPTDSTFRIQGGPRPTPS
jgi:signal transduction histidine kinase